MENDEHLVREAQQCPEAFLPLYDRYVERIYAYAQRETGDVMVAQDIVSATFEKALKNLPRYQWRGTSFGAWLYKIARNEILMHFRGGWRFLPLLDRFQIPGGVEQTVADNQQMDVILDALCHLPKRDQEIVRLHYYESLSHAEIGEILNCTSKNVAVRLHRALRRLRKQVALMEQEVCVDVSTS